MTKTSLGDMGGGVSYSFWLTRRKGAEGAEKGALGQKNSQGKREDPPWGRAGNGHQGSSPSPELWISHRHIDQGDAAGTPSPCPAWPASLSLKLRGYQGNTTPPTDSRHIFPPLVCVYIYLSVCPACRPLGLFFMVIAGHGSGCLLQS